MLSHPSSHHIKDSVKVYIIFDNTACYPTLTFNYMVKFHHALGTIGSHNMHKYEYEYKHGKNPSYSILILFWCGFSHIKTNTNTTPNKITWKKTYLPGLYSYSRTCEGTLKRISHTNTNTAKSLLFLLLYGRFYLSLSFESSVQTSDLNDLWIVKYPTISSKRSDQ